MRQPQRFLRIVRVRFADWQANIRRSGLPWRRVLSSLAANHLRRARRRSLCCGHPGHPGC